MHSYVHCSIISNSQDMESTTATTDGWIEEDDSMSWLLEIMLQWTLVTTLMDFEGIVLSEVTQIKKEKSLCDFTHVES